MKAYPINLRSQIVEAYKNHEGSMLKIACRFGVSRSFVQKIIKQEQQTGSLAPLPRGGSSAKLSVYSDAVEQLLKERQNATLEELCSFVKRITGVEVSCSTMSRFRQKVSRIY